MLKPSTVPDTEYGLHFREGWKEGRKERDKKLGREGNREQLEEGGKIKIIWKLGFFQLNKYKDNLNVKFKV